MNKPLPENITATRAAEFWQRVDMRSADECWPWLLCTDGRYGKFSVGHEEYKASRIAYYLTTGNDPGHLDVCHTCDNPICCNPAHLFAGTRKENLQDMTRKGRHACASPKGESNPKAKLNKRTVDEIRRRYAEGGIDQRALAREYGVARSLIGRVIKGTQWAHAVGGKAVGAPANQRVLMVERRLMESFGAELRRGDKYGFIVKMNGAEKHYMSLRDIRRHLFGEQIPSHHARRAVRKKKAHHEPD